MIKFISCQQLGKIEKGSPKSCQKQILLDAHGAQWPVKIAINKFVYYTCFKNPPKPTWLDWFEREIQTWQYESWNTFYIIIVFTEMHVFFKYLNIFLFIEQWTFLWKMYRYCNIFIIYPTFVSVWRWSMIVVNFYIFDILSNFWLPFTNRLTAKLKINHRARLLYKLGGV